MQHINNNISRNCKCCNNHSFGIVPLCSWMLSTMLRVRYRRYPRIHGIAVEMIARRPLRMVLFSAVLLCMWLASGSPTSRVGQQPKRVSKHLRKLYKVLVVRRKYSLRQQQQQQRGLPQPTDIQWSNTSLFIYFNLTGIHNKSRITKAHLLMYERRGSYMATLYQMSFDIVVTDASTSEIIFNKTVAANRRLRLINVLKVIKRWQKYPRTNKGLLVTVRDTGMFERTLWTFYPRRNVYVPALALFVQERNYLASFKMFSSQVVQLLVNGVQVL